MMSFFRNLKSDVLKLRRQPLLLVQLLVPLLGIAIFLAYYSFTPYSPISKVDGYLQVLAVAFPTMIGIVCSIAVEQESVAGNFQHLLTSPVKLLPFLSKLSLLLCLGFGSVLLASGGFGAGYIYLMKESPYGLMFYVLAACILFMSSVFLYILHFFISLRFGKGASIGLGIMESLLSALLLTGLGDHNWIFIPPAWAARFITIWVQYGVSPADSIPETIQLDWRIRYCVVGTLVIMVLLGLWIGRWEGQNSSE
ncbi:lantibiotic immunity ABC transporter MutG family permease subunit [Paenibacillus polymyxa]|uniref:lantibiotic immunity ABC transporter MutG family permease subunit n=1 Tax=Paenibacillus polymyxa TaxID=1406 RepID=UPI0025B6B01F|nr:lantibiotic immunity ABC transporter MutG family permease subunit [Paenibacillus polymyxa]MDN4079426.1 lantibiotic immunity ABC transporter MutG family permease subunit [Paenibacillus polymyxa]MDN4104848.1 lantibiotic immunity ABC transporter MutG family permease subunit [Paenibacillus polymyxa]MDN4115115.1 lantibiotic immunity ABC transporter MutG family permease subunit [Paenibacillus polymyxa]